VSLYVIDASAATEYLLRTPVGLKLAGVIEDAALVAPELLDVEVVSVIRRAVLRRQLTDQRALLAIEDLMDWSIDRISHIECSHGQRGNTVTMSAGMTRFTLRRHALPARRLLPLTGR
jgi:predicted nucleic acid-binding protein